MKQLAIRGFDENLERAIRQLARRDGISLNRAILKLHRRGAGLPDGQDCVFRVPCRQPSEIGSTALLRTGFQ